jgi:hypothetical protein
MDEKLLKNKSQYNPVIAGISRFSVENILIKRLLLRQLPTIFSLKEGLLPDLVRQPLPCVSVQVEY